MTQAATAQGKPSDRPATQDMKHNLQLSPAYPESAIKNKEEGTVVLLMQIGTDGKPLSFKVDPTTKASPDLVKAASDAAMTWRFNPSMKDGKPVVGHARVPVMFTLDPQVPETPSAASSNT